VDFNVPEITVDPCLGAAKHPVEDLTFAELCELVGDTPGDDAIAISGCAAEPAVRALREAIENGRPAKPQMILHTSLVPHSLREVFPAEANGFLQRCSPQDILLLPGAARQTDAQGSLVGHWLASGALALSADGTPDPSCTPAIGPGRPPVDANAIRKGLQQVSGLNELSQGERDCFIAGVLLLWDLLEESHVLSQSANGTAHSTTPDYWHGIMHRREPDLGNASYWFRRVGRHPAMDRLEANLSQWMTGFSVESSSADASGWDPFQVIDDCRPALKDPAAPETLQLRVRQYLEIVNLLAEPWA